MKGKGYLFVIDPLEQLNPEFDTSLLMMRELLRRKYPVSFCTPNEIFNDRGVVVAKTVDVTLSGDGVAKGVYYSIVPISYFHKVFFRIDPPVDTAYYQAALLLSHEDNVVNPAEKILMYNEKMIAGKLTDKRYNYKITKDLSIFKKFVNENKLVVVKPINDYTGNRVFTIDACLSHDKDVETIYNIVSNDGKEYLLVQEFFTDVYLGDKRVFVCGDEVIGVINRIPKEGTFIANIHKGATYHKDEMTELEKKTTDKVMDWMKKEKIVMASLDFIGERLTEVNITSPSGIPQINNAYNINLTPKLIDNIFASQDE